jgi:hypothetical protein
MDSFTLIIESFIIDLYRVKDIKKEPFRLLYQKNRPIGRQLPLDDYVILINIITIPSDKILQ